MTERKMICVNEVKMIVKANVLGRLGGDTTVVLADDIAMLWPVWAIERLISEQWS